MKENTEKPIYISKYRNRSDAESEVQTDEVPSHVEEGEGQNSQNVVPHLGWLWKDLLQIASVLASLYLLIILISYHPEDPGFDRLINAETIYNYGGVTGAWISSLLLYVFGIFGFSVPFAILVAAWIGLQKRQPTPQVNERYPPYILSVLGVILLLLSGSSLASMFYAPESLPVALPFSSGGVLGYEFSRFLVSSVDLLASTLLLLAMMATAISMILKLTWIEIFELTGKLTWMLFMRGQAQSVAMRERLEQMKQQKTQVVADIAAPNQDDESKPVIKKAGGDASSAAPESQAMTPDEASQKRSTSWFTTRLETVGNKLRSILGKPNVLDKPASSTSTQAPERRLQPAPEVQAILSHKNATAAKITALKPVERPVDKYAKSHQAAPLNNSDAPPSTPEAVQAPEGSTSPQVSAPSNKVTALATKKPEPKQEALAVSQERQSAAESVNATVASAPTKAAEPIPSAQVEQAQTPISETVTDASPNIELGQDSAAIPVEASYADEAPLHPSQQEALQLKDEAVVKPDWSEVQLPSLELLQEPPPSESSFSEEELVELSKLLEQRLQEFGISVEVQAVQPGPVVTQFEILPAPGVKVSQISNLSKDLARVLSVMSVRVVDVIPGKSCIGIEIPNATRETVWFQEVLGSDKFKNARSVLTVALGKDIAGNPVVADIAGMPHLLVAGTTGSGKSVGINSMILSMLYKASPEQVRMIMIDPKMLELSIYEDIPHLLSPVVTDMSEAANALRWSVFEMDRRYQLMSKVGVRNIAGYNLKVQGAIDKGKPIIDPLYEQAANFGHDLGEKPPTLEPMPYIVIVIDEYADLIMVVGKEVEQLVTRLAQKARAAGIHLILATQRPSVNVITGVIKSNIPTRMSFMVNTKIDSRTVLDQGGAEQLLGRGDMLYLAPGSGAPKRVHGAFMTDEEVHSVVDFVKSQGEPQYIKAITQAPESESSEGGKSAEDDSLFDEVVDWVAREQRVSVSLIQRNFSIGYNRAARLVDVMESQGMISKPSGGNSQREVLLPKPE